MDNGLRFLEMIQKVLESEASVSFHFVKPATLPHRRRLKTFLIWMVKKEANASADLSFVFCSDKYLLKMNRQFLQHDYFTDILSFPLDHSPGMLAGEMYLSIDRIRDNAQMLRVSVSKELHRVIFHGVLHLCGYRDKTPAEVTRMRTREDFYLKSYFKIDS